MKKQKKKRISLGTCKINQYTKDDTMLFSNFPSARYCREIKCEVKKQVL